MAVAAIRRTDVEADHLARESAAYEAYLAAGERGDHAEADRLWKLYRELHAAQPKSMVERLEREKGLR